MTNPNRYAAPALEKGLDILEYLARVGIPQSQTEIAQAQARGSSELFRMLACLEARGYVHRDTISGKYSLSLKLYHLGHTHSPVDTIRRLAVQPMYELAAKTGQPVHLGVLDRDEFLVIYQQRGPAAVSLSVEEGSRFPLLPTTAGRVLLSGLPPPARLALLQRLPDFQAWKRTRRDECLAELELIARQGYYTAPSQLYHGVSNVAARIGDPGAPVVATIVIAYVSTSLGHTLDSVSLVDATVAAARDIGRASGLAK